MISVLYIELNLFISLICIDAVAITVQTNYVYWKYIGSILEV